MDWQPAKARLAALTVRDPVRIAGRRTVGILNWIRSLHPARRFLTIILLATMLLIPVFGVASAFQDYLQLRALGQDAIHHLLAAKDALIPAHLTSKSGLTATCGLSSPTPQASATATPASADTQSGGGLGSVGIPDQAHIDLATHELHLAQDEFRQIGILIDQPSPTLAFGSRVPTISGKISSVRQLVYVGDDAITVALNLIAAVTPVLQNLRAGALASTTTPLLTTDQAATIRTAIVDSMSSLNDIETRLTTIDVNALPLNGCQRTELVQLADKLPAARSLLAQAPELFDVATWLGGVDHPRQFLVQMMDNWELRPTGGFTGLYGALSVSGARVQPFTLHDVNHFDYGPVGYGVIAGRRPPSIYDWWPFGNWGLRDASLSADFPTNARLVLQVFNDESGASQLGLSSPTMDGLIQMTPVPIEHVLRITGPIVVADYGETVTADNFEQVLHYWQNDFGAIAREQAICHASNDNTQVTKRKCFTEAVAQLLEQRVRQLPLNQLLAVVQGFFSDLKAHEIEVYLTDPQMESFLLQQGFAPRLSTSAGEDTFMMDQANVSIAKSTPNVAVNIHDDVALDAAGGATHHVTITFANTLSTVNAYSYITTYRDYVRIYLPRQSQLKFANGFDTGTPVCWVAPASNPGAGQPARFRSLPPCPSAGFFPDKSLVCPAGNWGPGDEGSNIFGNDGTTYWPVEDTGYPPNTTSDVPGLTMLGGYVVAPRNCTVTVTLDYYVSNVALPAPVIGVHDPAYTYLVERQAGAPVTADVHVQPASSVAQESNRAVQFTGVLSQDQLLQVPRLNFRVTQP